MIKVVQETFFKKHDIGCAKNLEEKLDVDYSKNLAKSIVKQLVYTF